MLDHVTLRTNDLEGTRAFLEAVLDLRPGYRPAFSFPGYWLYADGDPVVHLIPGHGGPADRTGETIDHLPIMTACAASWMASVSAIREWSCRSSVSAASSFGRPRGSFWNWFFAIRKPPPPSTHQEETNDQ